LCLKINTHHKASKSACKAGTFIPVFEKAAKIYMPSLGMPVTQELIERMRKTKIITKIVPNRIVMMDRNTHKSKGYHALQVWFPQGHK